jgi:hypothetical protein
VKRRGRFLAFEKAARAAAGLLFLFRVFLFPVFLSLLGAAPPKPAASRDAKPRVFYGTITDTECGPSHARMIARGGMGKTDAECTRACIRLGATYGVLVGKNRRFYQLDDQEKPAPFAGKRVRIVGRRDGDSILVESVGPAR